MYAERKAPLFSNKRPFALPQLTVVAIVVGLMFGWVAAAEPTPKSRKGGNATKAAAGPKRWEETIKRFEAADEATPPSKGSVLLVGGSNARRWTDVGDYFPNRPVINRGFGGAQLADVLYYADRIVLPYAPTTILLNAGGNDLASGKSPEQIRDSARSFIAKVHTTLPDTRIFQLGVPPVRRASSVPEQFKAIRTLNGLFAELATTEKNVEFIDLFPSFIDDEGQPRPELFVEDGTHFSPKGYAIVTGLIDSKLQAAE